MLLSRSATVFALAFIGLALPQPPYDLLAQEAHEGWPQGAAQDSPPTGCHVTLPSEGSFVSPSPVPLQLAANEFWFGTEKLWTRLPTDGTWRGRVPRKPDDFAYGDKFPLFRAYPGFSEDALLTVTGRRLDGPAPSFTETYHLYGSDPDGDNARMMHVGGISIPVFGCWQVTAQYKDQQLSFTVWVTPLPQQRMPAGDATPTVSQVRPTEGTMPRRIHLDGEIQARSLIYRVMPEIPREAEAANASGTVVLHAVITTEGRASELQYISGPRVLSQAAIDAVRWWRYEVATVATVKGEPNAPFEPLEVDTTIQVVFPAVHN
jgi:Gram-negative bacterial TonB protein C-terminal